MFPACAPCNRSTRFDEQFASLLSRSLPEPSTKDERREFEKLVESVSRENEAALRELMPSEEEVAEAREKYRLPDGHPPLLNVRGPHMNRAVLRVGFKLGCALYYLHSSRIVPLAGGVLIRWFTNVQAFADELPEEISQLTHAQGVVLRNSRSLSDQFEYRHGASADYEAFAFAARFRQSFLIFGLALRDVSSVPTLKVGALLRPRAF